MPFLLPDQTPLRAVSKMFQLKRLCIKDLALCFATHLVGISFFSLPAVPFSPRRFYPLKEQVHQFGFNFNEFLGRGGAGVQVGGNEKR